jgi:hypothetical protein
MKAYDLKLSKTQGAQAKKNTILSQTKNAFQGL